MNKFIDLVLRWPRTTILLLVIITIILTPGIRKLEFDNSVEAFLPRDDREYVYYNQIRNIYGDTGRFLIMAISSEDLWEPRTFSELNNFITDIEEYQHYDEGRESERLLRFDALTHERDAIPYGDVIAHFSDDPGFAREIARKYADLFGSKEILDRGNLKKLQKQLIRSAGLKKQAMIDEVISPFTAQDISGENDTLSAYYLIERDGDEKRVIPLTAEEITAFRKKLVRNPAFERGIYASDPATGEITDFGVIVMFYNKGDRNPIASEILQIVDSYKAFHIIPQGMDVVYIWINKYLHRDLFTFIPIVLFVVIVVFYLNFGTVRGVLLPFTSLAMGMFWVLGIMGHLGFKITALGVSLPVLMIAVGSSYSIHILNQYYADFEKIAREGTQAGLHHSMHRISLTVLLAGLTTFVSFASVVTTRLTGIREWGLFSALGVAFAVLISTSLIPAALVLLPHTMPLSMMKKNSRKKKVRMVDRIIDLAIAGSVRHHRKVLAVACIIMLISIAGIFRLEVETTFLNYFKESDPIRTNAKIIGDKFGGEQCLNILIDSGRPDGVKDPPFLNMVESLRTWLESEENRDLNIGRTDVISDYIKTMHMAMNEDKMAFYAIPESQSDIMDYLEIYNGDDTDSDGRVDEFEPYIDREFRTCDILARIGQKQGHPLGTADINYIVQKISDYLKRNLPHDYSYRLTGDPMINIKLAHYIILGQMQSLFLSLIVIGIVVTLLFYHFKAGLLALIPISLAVIFNFGVMGWVGIKLDLATSIIAAITIGIGVDDTIHFLNTFRHNRHHHLGVNESIAQTLRLSGKAIVFTSLALIFGFAVLLTSSFIPVILFGILMATTMIATTMGALVVLPAAIKLTGIEVATADESESWMAKYLNIGKLFGLEQEDEG